MAIVVPEDIVRFLGRATVGIAGTRGRDLVPHVHRASGWSVGEDRQTITCLVAEPFTADLLSSLEDNGQFALTVSEIPSHETYQLKGELVGSRAADAADLACCDRQRERFVAAVGAMFDFTETALRAYVQPPSIAIDVALREIFVQTPGPNAGKRLQPGDDGVLEP